MFFDDEADYSHYEDVDITPNEIVKARYIMRDEAFKRAYKMGVKMAFGTDQVWPDMVTREFSYLLQLGVSHWDAIAMATINSAELLGMKDLLGSIEIDKYADIVAVADNPLKDIKALERVDFVMKGGEVIHRH